MRKIDKEIITKEIAEAVQTANFSISEDLLDKFNQALKDEKSILGKDVLKELIKNAKTAESEKIPICQDTGIVVIFAEIGEEVFIEGDLLEAINFGIKIGYNEGFLRKSVVKDPFDRENTGDNTPAVIYTERVPGNKLNFKVLIKGAGSENMSKINMFNPTATKEEIIKFIIDTVKNAGANACPPYILGIGIGGTFEKAALLSKKALVSDKKKSNQVKEFEQRILKEVNKTGIGPAGLGGTVTALDTKVLTYPCHIASLPVAVNINCHASRHISITI
ncbi:MAG: fumarate hydratase [Halanaerobiales bacterium]|nr:fumarate hydratase [Halanaerobiales bacterium]